MEKAIRVLLLEDSDADADLILSELRRAGYSVEAERVETDEDLRQALEQSWDILLADYTLPTFDAPRALALLRELELDLPVIVVSGSIGEQIAIECLKNGAADYLSKDRLGHLGTAVQSALLERTLKQERCRANAELREREEMYRSLFESMDEGILYHAADGRVLSANPSVERILGIPLRILKGRTSIDPGGKAINAEGLPLPTDSQPHFAALRSRQPVRDILMGVWNARENARRWVLASSVPLFRSTERAPYQAITTLVDVTERRKIEEEQAFMVTAIEQAAESFIITDTDGTVRYANPAFTTTTGYELHEIIGKSIGLIVSEKSDPELSADLQTTIRQGKTWQGVVLNRRKDGTDYQEEITISPVRNAAGAVMGYVSAQRDVTQEMELQHRLQQSQKMDAVGRFATGIAHDFNNILQAIAGFNDMACEELDPEHPVQEHLHEVASASEKAAELIRQLLDFGSRAPSHQRLINPGTIVGDLAAMLRRVIGEDIELDLQIDASTWTIAGDPAQIEQAVMNLCVNARDAMPDGGTLTLRVENHQVDAEMAARIPKASEGPAVCITVRNNGPGMPPEVRDRIFEPFFSSKEQSGGAGMGLATVYTIVENHGGFIRLDSEPGEGTAFHLFLPAKETDAIQSPGDDANSVKLTGGNETILLAEDDEQARRLAMLILENAGYTVLPAGSGEEAIELFNEHRDSIALAALDVIMPGKSGKAVFEAIRLSGSTIPVLFMTGYSFYKLDSADAPGEQLHLLMKPFRPRELLTRIQTLLGVRT
ncbi:MAG: two-component system, cell cycle sensor histidine kinase and response regulator CckA [Candidatus Sumerlaeota bacterium]|nr:two-component system, cell cycle sensor histidine kinase and response regulator CckA [Candidatus Sumerlaeota bacterium]